MTCVSSLAWPLQASASAHLPFDLPLSGPEPVSQTLYPRAWPSSPPLIPPDSPIAPHTLSRLSGNPCDPDWYGPGCSVHCTPASCAGPPSGPQPHFRCEPDTGACVCQDDGAGHFGGPNCTQCAPGYWGPTCTEPCRCSGHGHCRGRDGACQCFADDARGYWAGEACRVCAGAYVGPRCATRSVGLARGAAMPFAAPDAHGPGGVVVDEGRRIAYAGAGPLVLFDLNTGAPVATLALGGTLRCGRVEEGVMTLLLEAVVAGRSEVRAVRLPRGPRPAVLSDDAFHWTPGPVALLETVKVQNVVYALVLSNGLLTATELPGGGAAASRRAMRPAAAGAAVPADALGLDRVGGAALWCRTAPADDCQDADGAAALLLAGSRNSTWQIVVLALPLPGRVEPLEAVLGPQLPRCSPTDPCVEAPLVAVQGDTLYAALAQRSGLAMVTVDMAAWPDAAGVRVLRHETLEGVATGAVVTAVALDAATDAVLVAAHVPGAPSVIHKYRAQSLALAGAVRMQHHRGAPEVVRALRVARALRRLYATTSVLQQRAAVTLLLWGVASVSPGVADAAGGTVVQVEGEGFRDGMRCWFGGALRDAPATVLGPRQLRCATPATDSTGPEALEVMLGPLDVTADRVALRRVPTPAVTTLHPSRGYYLRPQEVLLQGYGFVQSGAVACRFVSAEGAVRVSGGGNVTVLSSTQMVCRQPVLPLLEPPVFVEVSIDGQVCSGQEWGGRFGLATRVCRVRREEGGLGPTGLDAGCGRLLPRFGCDGYRRG